MLLFRGIQEQFPETTRGSQTPVNSSSWESNALFWLLWAFALTQHTFSHTRLKKQQQQKRLRKREEEASRVFLFCLPTTTRSFPFSPPLPLRLFHFSAQARGWRLGLGFLGDRAAAALRLARRNDGGGAGGGRRPCGGGRFSSCYGALGRGGCGQLAGCALSR